MTDVEMWSVMQGNNSAFVVVDEFNGANKVRAARELIDRGIVEPIDETAALAALAATARTDLLREHLTEPEGDCGCDDIGWWCEYADGPVQHRVYWWYRSDLDDADEASMPDQNGGER